MDAHTMTYWPWWLGGLALAAVAVGHAWFLRGPMGVSGLFTKLTGLRAAREVERADAALLADPAALEASLLEATKRAMQAAANASRAPGLAVAAAASGLDPCADPLSAPMNAQRAIAAAPSRSAVDPCAVPSNADVVFGAQDTCRGSVATSGAVQDAAAPRLTVSGAAVFLVSIAAGAAIARRVRGEGFAPSFDMGPTFTHSFGSGWGTFAALAFGGALVGAGTRMAGGCTSGHGLSGVARLQPASVLATAVFFGVGIAVSFLLAKVAS